MSAMHVVVRPLSTNSLNAALQPLQQLIDVPLRQEAPEGEHPLRRIEEAHIASTLVDLGFATCSLLSAAQDRVTLPLHTENEAWELGLEAAGKQVLVSLFRPGPVPFVLLHAHAVSSDALLDAVERCLRNAAQEMLSSTDGSALRHALFSLMELKAELPPQIITQRVKAQVSASTNGFTIKCAVPLRQHAESGREASRLERADLHSLLAEGPLTLVHGQNKRTLPSSQIFLDTERLLALAEEALESWRGLRPTFRRAQLTSGRLAMRRGPGEGDLELRVNDVSAGNRPAFVLNLAPHHFITAIARFSLELAHRTRKEDPRQRRNLRLTNLSRAALNLIDQCAATEAEESVSNPRPDSYKRFVPKLKRSPGMWEHGGKMRFAPRWVATIPAIDLRATFLCGDQIMVGSVTETACLDRRNGAVIWKKALRPAASVVTPSGLVRVEPDGTLNCHHLDDGEVRFGLKVTPRSMGGATGSVLYGPGLPKLLALAEGDRQISGIDLVTGDVRWRYTARRPGAYRIRRAGKLLIIAGGDPLMVALDGATGDVVWSLRSRMPFIGDVSVDHDSAYAISGSAGNWSLHQFDPWSGKQAWQVELAERPVLGRAPLLTPNAVVVPVADHEGAGALAFDRVTGEPLWEQTPGLTASTTAWLAVDDSILANSAQGTLLCLDAKDGHLRFNHIFARERVADQPRRLEPVLRSGALFVPQSQVHVVRPRDGELLGTLPSDLIPDLIRVDERCDVYVAEESGHLAAFGAAPRLALVR